MTNPQQWQSLFDRFVHTYGRLPTEVDPDYLEMLQMSKYRILDVPDVSPGKCANCGASKNDGRRYIDIGLHVDWYGAVYICGHCLTDLANTMGLFDDLKGQVAELESELENTEDLYSKGVELRETVTKLSKDVEVFYASIHSTESSDNSDSNAGVVSKKTSSQSGINKAESATGAAKPGTTKSTSVSGRSDIPSLTELLNKGGK